MTQKQNHKHSLQKMKFQCSAESTCTLAANYKNPTGGIVCRKHVESMETAVHIDWKKCRDCNSLKRLYKNNKCFHCAKTDKKVAVVAIVSVVPEDKAGSGEDKAAGSGEDKEDEIEEYKDAMEFIPPSTPRPKRATTKRISSTPRIKKAIKNNDSEEDDVQSQVSLKENTDKDKSMIRMLKILSKTRPVEVTVYKFTLLPPLMEEEN